MKKMCLAFAVSSMLILPVACGIGPTATVTRVDVRDSQLRQFASMSDVDRQSHGLAAIPSSGSVDIQRANSDDVGRRAGYDIMLRFNRGSLSKTVAFVLKDNRAVWIGEQDVHYGPRTMQTVDGEQREQVSVTYYPNGAPSMPTGLRVEYTGPDDALEYRSMGTPGLSVADLRTVLRSWGEGIAPSSRQ